jgi:hypothetical protein
MPAATIGSTVYLPAVPDIRISRQRDLMAHELVHVGAQSTRPRFYGGPIDPEEQRARSVGRDAAGAAPAALLTLGVANLAVGGGAVHPHTHHRETDALMMLQRATGPTQTGIAATSATWPATAATPARRSEIPGSSAGRNSTIARATEGGGGTASGRVTQTSSNPDGQANATTNSTVRHDEIDAMLEALEDRVLADLERRGGRFAGEF